MLCWWKSYFINYKISNTHLHKSLKGLLFEFQFVHKIRLYYCTLGLLLNLIFLWPSLSNNQQDATTFSFSSLFDSALHVSDDKFTHPQEHVLTSFHLNRGTGRQQCRCIVPKAVYRVKTCSWGWVNLSPETCRAESKRLLNEKVVASCWLFTSCFF